MQIDKETDAEVLALLGRLTYNESHGHSIDDKNHRAIRFYEKNEFKDVGELSFLVNGKHYPNIVFSKRILP